MTTTQTLKILCISGSLREDSLNKKLLGVCERISLSNVALQQIGLGHYECPPYNADLQDKSGLPDSIKKLSQVIMDSHALIISSPEYNHSMPGHLKNTFDWVSSQSPIPWSAKPTLLLSASPSLLGGSRAVSHLRAPFMACGAFVYPQSFSLSLAQQAFGTDGTLKDQKLSQDLKALLEAFYDFAARLSLAT